MPNAITALKLEIAVTFHLLYAKSAQLHSKLIRVNAIYPYDLTRSAGVSTMSLQSPQFISVPKQSKVHISLMFPKTHCGNHALPFSLKQRQAWHQRLQRLFAKQQY